MNNESQKGNPQPLEILIYNACLHLKEQNYVHEGLRKYRATWHNFLMFCKTRNVEFFQWEMAEQFLISIGIPHPTNMIGASARQKYIVRHMLCLSEFNIHGSFARNSSLMKKSILKDHYEILLSEYVRFCVEQKGIVFRSISHIESVAKEFLFFIQIRGLESTGQITGQIIGDYFKAKAYLSPCSIADVATKIRGLLRYLVMRGLADAKPIGAVPTIRSYSGVRIPEVWSQEDIEKLLETVDRSSPKGKRNYVILLLAARLGMRPGDIRNLTLENLNWEENKIDIIQGKTGKRLELPLSNEIGAAIIDYLRNGRPKTTHREIFTTLVAPFSPLGLHDSCHHIITKYRQLAGIKLPERSSRGLYTLRHSIATHLLEVGTPLETISAIMGHVTPDVTLVYMKADVASLRQVALDLGKENDKCI
jgi:integrase